MKVSCVPKFKLLESSAILEVYRPLADNFYQNKLFQVSPVYAKLYLVCLFERETFRDLGHSFDAFNTFGWHGYISCQMDTLEDKLFWQWLTEVDKVCLPALSTTVRCTVIVQTHFWLGEPHRQCFDELSDLHKVDVFRALSLIDTAHPELETLVYAGKLEQLLLTPAKTCRFSVAEPAIESSKAEKGFGFVKLARLVQNWWIWF